MDQEHWRRGVQSVIILQNHALCIPASQAPKQLSTQASSSYDPCCWCSALSRNLFR